MHISPSPQAKKPAVRGWVTTDEDEVALRRQRAQTEPMRARALQQAKHAFVDYEVARLRAEEDEARPYLVELRCLDRRVNTCSCPDFEKNGLGTCKHVEYVLQNLSGAKRKRVDSPFVEVYMAREPDYRAAVQRPDSLSPDVDRFIESYLTPTGELRAPWETTLTVLLHDLDQNASEKVRDVLRVSREVRAESVRIQRRRRLADARRTMERRLSDPQSAPAIVRHTLYDYQREGMLHLAFAGRALLADEMGLGKTVQAIAACRLLRDMESVERVLVVCPASLKTEWEEQIRKFTNLPVRLVYGDKKTRDRLYRETDAFFTVTNYEQILRDLNGINRHLQPDVVILDEAQRIKNWQTKTARAIKRLAAPYAFVLTGTPLENRIDEIYSLVEFIDPHVFGSLFRFNRDFYTFDDRGRAQGLKNMRELNRRLEPIMLRRRKDQIAEQLPERVDNNYFVPLSAEQRDQYEEYERPVAALLAAARKRQLLPAEMEKLQRLLNCMRMVCDSLYILDQETKHSPKIDEFMAVLDDVWTNEPTRKILVFSEWERMLYLLSQALDSEGLDHAWHTGSVPQDKRREEINRFKESLSCRLFLSTDSGATGLNLQAAGVVVNLDLPWNPAKLEQRIARAWRKHQSQSVQVINLVAESSLEHRMLGTLAAKRELADGVLDARGDLDNLQLPSARAAFLQRLEQVVDAPVAKPDAPAVPKTEAAHPEPPPHERFEQALTVKLRDRLLSVHSRRDPASGTLDTAWIVVDRDGQSARNDIARLWNETVGEDLPPSVHVLDRRESALLRKLAETGAVTLHDDNLELVYESDAAGTEPRDDSAKRRSLAEPLLAEAERQVKMADLLAGGGFEAEAVPPLRRATDRAGCALVVLCANEPPAEVPETFTDAEYRILAANRALDDAQLAALRSPPDAQLRNYVDALLQVTAERLAQTALS